MAKFSKEQQAYMVAKVAYEVAIEEFNRRRADEVPESPDNYTKTQFRAYNDACNALRKDLDTDSLFAALIDAENTLLNWGHEVVKRLPQYRVHAKDLENLYTRINYHPKHREHLVNLTMKLSA